MAKIHVANLLHEAADIAIQINGARGYSKDTVLEWIYRYARQARLVDGADEVHKMILNRHLEEQGRASGAGRARRAGRDEAGSIPTGLAGSSPRPSGRRGSFGSTGSGAGSRTRPSSSTGATALRPAQAARRADPEGRACDRPGIPRAQALAPTAVPVPRPVLYHADPALLGTPFYLMERVEGRIFTDTALAALPANGRAEAVWMALADTLAASTRSAPRRWASATTAGPAPTSTASWPLGPAVPRLALGPRPRDRTALRLADRAPAARRRPRLALPRGLPARATSCSTRRSPGSWSPCSTGSCRRSVIRSRTSGSAAWPGTPRPRNTAGFSAPTSPAWAARRGRVRRPYMAASRDPAPLLPFHKAFALYRFAVIFVGIADRARAGSAADPEAARLGPLAVASPCAGSRWRRGGRTKSPDPDARARSVPEDGGQPEPVRPSRRPRPPRSLRPRAARRPRPGRSTAPVRAASPPPAFRPRRSPRLRAG
jgi:hypothetical protein